MLVSRPFSFISRCVMVGFLAWHLPANAQLLSDLGGDDEAEQIPYFSFFGGMHTPSGLSGKSTVTVSGSPIETHEKQHFNSFDGLIGLEMGSTMDNWRFGFAPFALNMGPKHYNFTLPQSSTIAGNPTSGNLDGSFEMVGAFLNTYYDFRSVSDYTVVSTPFVPYVGLGFGGARVNTKAKSNSFQVTTGSGKNEVKGTANAFLFQGIFGARYNVSDSISVFTDIRYMMSGAFKFASLTEGIGGGKLSDKLVTTAFVIGITRSFP